MTKPTVFISYSHKDEIWKDRLKPHLGVLERLGKITIWDDREIDPGGKWFDEIQVIMDEAAVSLCLISSDYLCSEFCTKEEIPYLLERSERDGMVLLPVLVRPCPWKAVPWLSEIQMLPRDGQSVSKDYKDDWDTPFAEVAGQVFSILEDPAYQPPMPPPPRWAPPEKIDIQRMPSTGAKLFGRQKELKLLDDTWENDTTNVVSFVAWGGVGKSTLVNKWLDRMKADNYRAARRVYAWSFYSQGTGERVTSADQFMGAALDWFGDPDPAAGSSWDKGQRLAGLVRREKTLLLLDGMEPLQSGHDFERGKIEDPALAMLVAELARDNPGLCVITTRATVADLRLFEDTTIETNLEQISPEAGRALLRVGGVRGTDAELEAAVEAFGGHALALNLLTTYLHDIPGHHISHAAEIPDLPDVTVKDGKHPRRVMAVWVGRLRLHPPGIGGTEGGGRGAVELLHLLGLFDRPAEAAAIAALRADPLIPGLTERLSTLDEVSWLRTLGSLRAAGLLAEESAHRPGTLDTHPLVREHFGAQLRAQHPEAWRAANDRLYEHYKEQAPHQPDTLAEMTPLFQAVAHGCAAERHQEAFLDVYWQRIRRGKEAYSVHKLGAFGSDLAALSNFFDPPWSRPVDSLREDYKAAVLNWAGFRLRALGRLTEAAQPMQAGLDADIARQDWNNAARAAGSLSELHLTRGDVPAAIAVARQSVELADKSGDAFMRMANRTALADALHQAGQLDEAAALFREAEALQKERQPSLPLLYSLQGYQYCDLLLGQGTYQEVQERINQLFEWRQPGDSLLDIALEHLSLGRAAARQEPGSFKEPGSYRDAAQHLHRAVDGLRQSGNQDMLPLALLSRAALYRLTGEFEKARRDLEESLQIAVRGGMKLHQCDAHLESVRLYLASGDLRGLEDLGGLTAREHLSAAQTIIAKTGYHRRDGEVEALAAQLAVR